MSTAHATPSTVRSMPLKIDCPRQAISKDFSNSLFLYAVSDLSHHRRTSSWLVNSQLFVGGSGTCVDTERWSDTSFSRWTQGAMRNARSHVGMPHSRQCRQLLRARRICSTCLRGSTTMSRHPVITLRAISRRVGPCSFCCHACSVASHRRQWMLMELRGFFG